MKTIRRLTALCVPLLFLAGCVSPSIVSESTHPGQMVKVSSLLIVMDASVFTGSQFHGDGRKYMMAMADVLRGEAGDIPVAVVTVDPMSLGNELGKAIITDKPSQIMRLHTVSVRSNQYGLPLDATWQLDLENVSQHPIASNASSGGQIAVSRKAVYRLQMSGPTCIGWLSSESRIRECGAKMGQAFADRLHESHVMTPDRATSPAPLPS